MTDAAKPETFTAWITDRDLFIAALGGIRLHLRAAVQPRGSHVVYDYNAHVYYLGAKGEGRTWHRTRDAAVARANEMREAKIASLLRQIDRLRKMEF